MRRGVSLGNLLSRKTQQPLLEYETSDDIDRRPESAAGSFRLPRRPSTEEVAELEDWAIRADESRLVSKCGTEWQIRTRTRKRRRHGRSRVQHANKAINYMLRDPFTTLIDAHWPRVLIFGCSLYIFLWFFFAVLYFVFNHESMPGCHSSDLKTFSDAFLLSVDSQSTIGFGNYSVSSDCLPGIFVLVIQLLTSIIVDAAFIGLVFAKISRPEYRAESIVFSNVACVTEINGSRFLSIRVADQRKQQLCEAHARLLMFYTREGEIGDDARSVVSKEGFEPVEVEVRQLKLESKEVFLLMPWVIRHKIDESSPLWSHTLQDLEDQRTEFVLILEGSTASTSQTMQAKQSYLPCEILLNHEFESCCGIDDKGRYEIDFDRVNATRPQRPPAALSSLAAHVQRTASLRPDVDATHRRVPSPVPGIVPATPLRMRPGLSPPAHARQDSNGSGEIGLGSGVRRTSVSDDVGLSPGVRRTSVDASAPLQPEESPASRRPSAMVREVSPPVRLPDPPKPE